MSDSSFHRLNILLAIDGSQHSRAATHLLNDLPLSTSSTITAVAVLIPRNASDHAFLEASLEEVKKMLEHKGVPVETRLLTGYPAEQLTELAHETQPDLILLGAKGRRATLGILLGGVAQQMVEYAQCPLLVVRAPYSRLQRVLLVSDGSQHSQKVVEYMGGRPLRLRSESAQEAPIRFNLPPGVRLEVMHVLPPPPLPTMISRSWASIGAEAISQPLTPEMEEAFERQAEEERCAGEALLAETVKQFKDGGIEARSILLRGDAATEILDYASQKKVDLIIAGSRGLSPVRSWLLGSVSRKLVHYAECSVLIVK